MAGMKGDDAGMREVATVYESTPVAPWGSVGIDPAVAAGLLSTLESRGGRRALVFGQALLTGQSKRMAACTAGVSDEAVRLWGKADPKLAEAVERVRQIGLARTVESELYRRAFAGAEDRSSARLLELIVKAQMPEYRDHTQISGTLIHVAQQARAALNDGWGEAPEVSNRVDRGSNEGS